MKPKAQHPAKVKYFSWFEYFSLLVSFALVSSLPGFLYGADLSLLWSRYTIWYLLYWAVIAAVLCAVTAWQKYKKFEGPLRKLGDATQKVAGGDFSVYIQPEHTLNQVDYIDVMYRDFNKMVAELGSIQTLKNDFISNVSHEIKTPLSVIKSYSTTLKKTDLPEAVRQEYLDTVIQASDRLTDLVTNILRLNKLEHQEIAPKAEPFDLCRQLCDCALRYESLWEQKNITFEVEIEDKAIILGEETILELVWNNLFSNALKFTPDGGTVTLNQTSDRDSVTVSISDTGCGMSDDTMRHIFDQFYQGDASHSCEGNGLGLALTQRVVERIDGTISVISQLGAGSTFTVVLPVR